MSRIYIWQIYDGTYVGSDKKMWKGPPLWKLIGLKENTKKMIEVYKRRGHSNNHVSFMGNLLAMSVPMDHRTEIQTAYYDASSIMYTSFEKNVWIYDKRTFKWKVIL